MPQSLPIVKKKNKQHQECKGLRKNMKQDYEQSGTNF